MLSVVVFGRNDHHGYNSHRRAALSLNAISEVLRGDDEIVFVDYASPDGLPTLPEAIGDTLSKRCRALMRVVRVPKRLHDQRVPDDSHLPVSEPLARNIGIRRIKPESRWVLNTNTDMLFVLSQRDRLIEVVEHSDKGFFAIPRFEIPEWFWEGIDRLDGPGALEIVRESAPKLHLNQVVQSHRWVRFDAPGDFQLVRRDALESVRGFDERMVYGWHVDSNLSRRLSMAGVPSASLEESVAGYHMNHNRVQTLVARSVGKANSLQRFFYEPDGAAPPGQEDWGLAGEQLDEIELLAGRFSVFLEAASSSPDSSMSEHSLDARDQPERISYDARQVLPFVLDLLTTAGVRPRVGYLGAGTEMRRLLAKALDTLGGELVDLSQETWPVLDAAVLDCGVGLGSRDSPGISRAILRQEIPRLLASLESLVSIDSPPPLAVINGSQTPGGQWASQFVTIASVTPACNVSAGLTKRKDEVDRGAVGEATQRFIWALRDPASATWGFVSEAGLTFSPVAFPDGWGEGWDAPTSDGIRMADSTAEIRFRVANEDGFRSGDIVILALQWTASDSVSRDEALCVDCRIDGRSCWSGTISGHDAPVRSVIDLQAQAGDDGVHCLSIVAESQESAGAAVNRTDDFRPNGPFVRLMELRVVPADRPRLGPGDRVRLTESRVAEAELLEGWDQQEPNGVWMRATSASFEIWVSERATNRPGRLILGLNDIRGPETESVVRVAVNGLPDQLFRLSAGANEVHVPIEEVGPLMECTLSVDSLVSPASLGMSDDDRALGLFLTSIGLDEV